MFLGYGIGRFSRRSLSGEGRQAFWGDGLIMALARKSVRVEDLQTRAGHESGLINLTSLLPLMVWRKLSQIKQELP